MATEIERKYRVLDDGWRQGAGAGVRMCQGYLNTLERASVRVRISGDRADLNIKSAELGVVRQEYEYPIPLADAEEMVAHLCLGAVIEKTRYTIAYGGYHWEVDCFAGANAGLVIAEVELPDTQVEPPLPPWVGEEVSDDPRYYNPCLVTHPYNQW